MSSSSAQAGIFTYAACSVSIAPLRREPAHRSEQTSQLLFGERVEVLQRHEDTDWAHVRCAWDGYEGWCRMGQLRIIAAREFHKEVKCVSSTADGVLKMEEGRILLPLGSELTGLRKGMVPVGLNESAKFSGRKGDLRKAHLSPAALLEAAYSFLHAPYQWGGRSHAGVDCSGLIQIAFKCCGLATLRDASQQATMGREVHFLAEAQPGDVAFFDNAEGHIVHVGFLIDRHNILHATDTAGRVVHDRVDNAGIISVSLKKRTHNLRTVRRIGL